jgi:hypothetical protein
MFYPDCRIHLEGTTTNLKMNFLKRSGALQKLLFLKKKIKDANKNFCTLPLSA